MTPKEHKAAYDRERYLTKRAERLAAAPPDPIALLTETDVAYLAGLTDADGTIYVTHTNRCKTYYPAISWAMTHKPTIVWVAEALGIRSVHLNNHTNLRRGTTSWGSSNFKEQWRATMAGSRAQRLCVRMIPHMKTKQAQAHLVASFPCDGRVGPGVKLDEGIRATRIDLGQQISALNRA